MDNEYEYHHTGKVSGKLGKIVLYVVGGALFLMISGCVRCILYCRRKRQQERRAEARVLAPPPALDAPPRPARAAPPAPPAPPGAAPYPQQQYAAPYPGKTYPDPSYQPAVLPPEGAGYMQGVAPAAGYPPPGASATSAPDANMMPPSYEQAVCAKPPPHNPYASH